MNSKKNKIFISACAEGNGHLTQALAYKERLNLDESEASVAIVAKKRKGIPLYFKKEFNSIIDYDGFDFVFGKSGNVVVWKSFVKNIFKIPLIVLSVAMQVVGDTIQTRLENPSRTISEKFACNSA